MYLELSVISVSVYMLLFFLSLKRIAAIPIMPMFLISFGVVIMSRPVIGIFFPEFNIGFGTWVYWGDAPEEYVRQSLLLIIVFLMATVFFYFLNSKVSIIKSNEEKTDLLLQKISLWLLMLSFPVYIYRGIFLWNGIEENGYLSTFTGEIKPPLYVNFGTAVFQLAYYFFLSSRPRLKTFYYVSFLYLVAAISSLGTGQRTEFVTSVLFFLFVSYFYNYNRFSFKKIIILGGALVLTSMVVNAFRLNESPVDALKLGLIEFFWGQGNTFFTLVGTLENRSQFNTFEGLFFPNKLISCDLMPYFTGEFCNNSVSAASTVGVWWQKLTYILDPDLFGQGGGLGGSIIPSLYLIFNFEDFYLSLFFFFIVSLIFWKFVVFLHDVNDSKVYMRVYKLFALNSIIFIPRGGLDALIPHPRFLIVGFFIYLIYAIAGAKESRLKL